MTQEEIQDLDLAMSFWIQHQQHDAQKRKLNNLDLIKRQNFHFTNKQKKKLLRESKATGLEKNLCKAHVQLRTCIQNIQRIFLNSTLRKETTQLKNGQKFFTDEKEDTQMANKRMKICST